jgi:hypothetical protein
MVLIVSSYWMRWGPYRIVLIGNCITKVQALTAVKALEFVIHY